MAYYAGDGDSCEFGYCDPFAKGEEISSQKFSSLQN